MINMKTVASDGARPGLGWAPGVANIRSSSLAPPAPGTRSQCFIKSNIKTDIGYIVVVLLLVTAPVFLLTLISTMK